MAQVQSGAKLGTRIATLVSNAVIYTHSRLHNAKHRLAMAVFHSISDVISDEVHDTIGPILRKLHSEAPDDAISRGLLEFMATQRGQLQAMVGTAAGATGILSSIAQIVNNELAPSVRGALGTNPHLIPDSGTIAGLVARGLAQHNDGVASMNQNGLPSGWAEALIEANKQYPDVMTMLDLVRKGKLGRDNFIEWSHRNAVPLEVAQVYLELLDVPISPADAALALLRGNITRDQALQAAAAYGVNAQDFDVLVNNTGEPLGLMQLLEAFRRGIIDEATVRKGILQSRVRDEWIDTAIKLRYSPMSIADAVNAVVQGHLTDAQGNGIAEQNGLEPGSFDTLVATAGAPLSRTEMEELYNRGEVTQAQVKQALLESRLKNKYTDLAFSLHTKLLPVRNLSEAVEFGTMSLQDAVAEAMKNGFNQRDATALIQAASARKLQQYKHQVVSAVETLYVDNAISLDDAKTVASSMGFDELEAEAIFKGAEYKRLARMVNSAISAIRSKYIARHIDESEASALLDGIGVPSDRRDQELKLWKLERQADIRLLTPAEVVKATKNGIFTQQQGQDYLINLGYSEADAIIRLKL